jgi:hypothetical protein
MHELEGPGSSPESDPELVSGGRPGSNLDRKFRVAMAAYGILAVVIWFTLGEGSVFVLGRPVEIRLIPLFVIGTFVLRALVAREADRIRRRSEDEAGKL